MPTSLQTNYDQLREAVASLKGWDRNFGNWPAARKDLVDDVIRSGLRRVYSAHEWNFLRPSGTLELPAPYATGTVTVAEDSAGSIVTLAGGTWPDWAADGILTIEGGGRYLVASRTSNSVIVLEASDVEVTDASEFTLARWRFDLDDDFGGVEGSITYIAPDNYRHPIKTVHESDIRLLLDDRYRSYTDSYPQFASVFVRAHDQTTPQTWKLVLYPPASQRLVLHYRYRSQPNAIDADNPYPLGGSMHSELITEAVLAEAEIRLNTVTREHEARYAERLQAAIRLDSDQGAPDSLSVMKQPFNDEFNFDAAGESVYPWMCPGRVIPEGYEDYF